MTYLSYSGWKTYATCPCQYWHKYVNKTRLQLPENGLNTLFGSTVGVVFEAFYRDRIYKRPKYVSELQGMAESVLDKAIKDQIKQGRIVDWTDEKSNYPRRDKEGVLTDGRLASAVPAGELMVLGRKEILSDAYIAIAHGVNTIRDNRFVGPLMEAELKLDTRFGPHIIGGRSDFVVKRVVPYNDVVIIDGKGSQHREKYVDGKPRKEGQPVEGVQLKWYAFLYREQYKRPPDTLAYIFWRYSGEKAVEWVPFTESDLDVLKDETLSTVKRIDRTTAQVEQAPGSQTKQELREELFPAQSGHHCTLCAYSEVCTEGQKYVAQFEGRKRKAKATLPKGVTDFSLGLDDD